MRKFKYNPDLFQNLNDKNHRWNSEESTAYNCVGYALGFTDKKIWMRPPDEGFEWPFPLPENEDEWDDLNHFIDCFERQNGYQICENGDLEPRIEKIALYGVERENRKIVRHAAIQRPNGEWASKMGWKEEDIVHSTSHDVTGLSYGIVLQFMKRERR